MQLKENTILITGGATGIGLAMAALLTDAGNEVIVCGRREDKLEEAKAKYPALHTRVCDIKDEAQRRELIKWATARFNNFNMLINNAGIQQMLDFKSDIPFEKIHNEIVTNLAAPIHLSALVTAHFQKQVNAAIVNITSGLGFIPLAIMPVYCATKAAMHSFSLSLRHQLKDTAVKVFEIIPPMVDTDLDKGARDARGQVHKGMHVDAFAKEAIQGLKNDEYECAVEMAKNSRQAARSNPDEVFARMNSR